jgi:hypothetical protein
MFQRRRSLNLSSNVMTLDGQLTGRLACDAKRVHQIKGSKKKIAAASLEFLQDILYVKKHTALTLSETSRLSDIYETIARALSEHNETVSKALDDLQMGTAERWLRWLTKSRPRSNQVDQYWRKEAERVQTTLSARETDLKAQKDLGNRLEEVSSGLKKLYNMVVKESEANPIELQKWLKRWAREYIAKPSVNATSELSHSQFETWWTSLEYCCEDSTSQRSHTK